MSLEFLGQAREAYSCDIDWSFDSCEGAIPVAAGASLGIGAYSTKRIQSNLTNRPIAIEFNNYIEQIAKFEELNRTYWSYQYEAERINKVNGNVFDKFQIHEYSPAIEEKYEKMAKNPAFKEFENKWIEANKNAENAKAKAKEFRNKILDPMRDKWAPKTYDKNVKLSLRQSFQQLTNTELALRRSNLAKIERDVYKKYYPDSTSDKIQKLTAEIASNKADFEKAQKNFKSEVFKEHSAHLQRMSALRGGILGLAGGVALGLAIEKIPHALNYIKSKTCSNLKGHDEVREYLQISLGVNDCAVALDTPKEFDLLTKSPMERARIFDKYPILCKAFIKKYDERVSRLSGLAIEPTLLKCTTSSAEASIKINNRRYDFTIDKVGEDLVISSQLGRGGEIPEKPVYVNWKYLTRETRFSSAALSSDSQSGSLMSTNALPDGELNLLQQSYLDLRGEFNPLLRMNTSGKNNIRSALPRDVVGTVAEQSIALKHGLPQIVQACGSISDFSGTAQKPSPPAH
ncbi:MAG: hypothetical protein SGJ18_08435 [Pseudomonadota bacterium]|nr:hypothetical protein [Pseudomonadota bacterium]